MSPLKFLYFCASISLENAASRNISNGQFPSTKRYVLKLYLKPNFIAVFVVKQLEAWSPAMRITYHSGVDETTFHYQGHTCIYHCWVEKNWQTQLREGIILLVPWFILANPNSLAVISKWPFYHSDLIFKLPIHSSAINILLSFISAGWRFQRKFFMISNVKRGHDICR